MSNWVYPETTPNGAYWDKLWEIADSGIDKANAAITEINSGTIPDTLDLLNASDLDINITLPNLPNTPDLTIVDYGAVLPSAPTLTMSAVATDAIISSLISTAKAELEARLNGTSTIEAQIFGNYKDKVTAEASGAYDKAKDSMAGDGFSRPTGAQLSTFEGFTKTATEQISDSARQTAIYIYDVTQKTLDQITALEANLINAKAGDESNKIRLYETGVDAYINLIKLGYELASLRVEMYKGEAQAYAAVASARSEEAGFLIAKLNAVNDANKKLLDFALARLQAVNEKGKAAGSIAAQLAATAMNGMNLNIGFSYSQSKSEGHSFDG